MLTSNEIDTYRRDGFVVPAGFRLGERELDTLRHAVEAVIADNAAWPPDRMINVHLNGGKPYGLRGQQPFHDLVHDPRILDMAEAVVGPDIVLLFTHLFCKPAGSSRAVPWHQDGPFWPIRPLASCTVWLAIDTVDAENGAMEVIPGSHRGVIHDHDRVDDPDLVLNREIPSIELDHAAAIPIELEAGQVSLHDIGLVHGSAANRSSRRRAGLAIRYMPATCEVHRRIEHAAADWSDMPVELVRGRNRNPGTDFSPGEFGIPWGAA